MTSRPTVLLTDYAWPDIAIEAELLEDAGFHLIAGPAKAASADAITALAAEHQPAAIMTNWAPVSAAAIAASRRCASSRVWVSGSTISPSMRLPDAASGSRMCRTTPSRRCRTTPSPCCWLVRADSLTTIGRSRAGRWDPAGAKLRRVRDLTCGIIGFGRTGRRTAEKLRGFGLRLLAHTRRPVADAGGVEMTTLDELLRRSDAVMVHVPLTAHTHHLLDRERIALMKPGLSWSTSVAAP